jgi:DNA-directed RNA polymerase specialized sigma24 family protein
MPLDNLQQTAVEGSFAKLFNTFTMQRLAFFRARRYHPDDAEDLAQEVMLKVYLKISQLRDHERFRAWLFTIASNAPSEHYERWDYHEIAAANNLPIGTVQWRAFNAKKKLDRHLKPSRERLREAA